MVQTLKQFMGSRTTAVVGQVNHGSDVYWVRLRHAAGIGCVTAQIAPKGHGKWESVSGRFSDETNMRHIINHVREFALVDGCALILSASAQAAYDQAETESNIVAESRVSAALTAYVRQEVR